MLPSAAMAAPVFSDMPEDYSTSALQAAVENGLINGSNGKIMPNENLTRAQMGAIISRAFGAVRQSSLDSFSDVSPSEWYYAEMGKAVHMKVFKGADGRLNPNSPITRQEAFAVVARALKLQDGTAADLAAFSDGGEVSAWAVGTTAAMVANGYIHGANGRLNPKDNISRKDFAVMMDNIIKNYINTPGTVTKVNSGSVMINVPNVTLKDVTVKGNLIIGDGVEDGNVVLDNVKVEGKTIVRGGGVNSFIIKGNSSLGKITIAKVDGNIRICSEENAKADIIEIEDGKDDVVIEGAFAKLDIAVSDVPVLIRKASIGEVSATAEKAKITVEKGSMITALSVKAANVSVAVGGKVETITMLRSGEGTKIEVAAGATVGTVNADAPMTSISGEGKVNKANVTANNVRVDTKGTEMTVGKGVSGVTSNGKTVEPGTTVNTGESAVGGVTGGGTVPPVVNTAKIIKTEHMDGRPTSEVQVKVNGSLVNSFKLKFDGAVLAETTDGKVVVATAVLKDVTRLEVEAAGSSYKGASLSIE